MPPWDKYSEPAAGPWAKFAGQPAEQPQPEMGFLDQAKDLAKSAGIGVANAAVGIAGLPGDLQRLARMGADYFDPQHQVFAAEDKSLLLPSSSDVKKTVEGYTGEFYKPQTTAGKYAETVGEFLPGGFAKKAVDIPMRVVRRALAPAVASEAAGQLTEGTAAEPVARVVGALAGGTGAERLTRAKSVIPSGQELKQAYKDTADSVRANTAPINPQVTGQVADRITQSLLDAGYRDYLAPKTFRAVEELRNPVNPTASTIGDVEGVRRALNKAGKDFTESDAVRRSRGEVDKLIEVLAPEMKDARANYAAYSRSKEISKALDKAENQAGGANSGMNKGNAARQQIKSILNSDTKTRGFSSDEIDQMEKIVRGTRVGNALRYTGNLFGGGGGLAQLLVGAGSAGAAGVTGDPRYLAIPAVGMGARALANRSTMKQINKLEEMVRARSPLAQSILANSPAQQGAIADPLVAALLAGNSSQGPIRVPVAQ